MCRNRGQKPQELEDDLLKSLRTNIVANVHLFNLYIPLILKGRAKKVITLTSGHADLDCINQYELDLAPLYSISKAGMNAAVGKFHAQYKKEGVLFISISPGLVNTGHHHGGMGTLFQNHNIKSLSDLSSQHPQSSYKK